jgi:hypothetical protein
MENIKDEFFLKDLILNPNKIESVIKPVYGKNSYNPEEDTFASSLRKSRFLFFAINKISNQDYLFEIAKNVQQLIDLAKYSNYGATAITNIEAIAASKLENEESRIEIIKNASSSYAVTAAIKTLTSENVLKSIVQNGFVNVKFQRGSWANTTILNAAKTRLSKLEE